MSNSVTLNTNNPFKIITDSSGKKYLLALSGLGSAIMNITEIIDINYNSNNNQGYLIENSNQLLCLFNNGNSNYYNIINNPIPNFSKDTFTQMSNINLVSQDNPIMLNTFSGTYNGNNQEIQNINIKQALVNNIPVNIGLFSSLSNATIKNINITGKINIGDNNGFNIGGCDFGCIAGYAENSTISDCKVSATMYNVQCFSFGGIVQKAKNSVIIRNNFNAKSNVYINEKYAGGIVAVAENSKILFNTNSMIGDLQTINNTVGGIYGGYSNGNNTIYGNLNIMKGNINSTVLLNTIGGIQGQTGVNDNIQLNINAMYGNLISGVSNNGGIVGDGINNSTIQYNINAQVGTINGSGIVDSVGSNTIVKYNVNAMRGICSQAACIKINYSTKTEKLNNLIMMRGYSIVNESSIFNAFSYSNYGFSNTTNIIENTPMNVIKPNEYFKYYNDSNYVNLPIIPFDIVKQVQIDSTIYNGPAPYWAVYYPNIIDNSYTSYNFTSNNLYSPFEIINSNNSLIKIKFIN